jgi:predicted permease
MINPRLALRTLFKTPFVTAVTIISLALGIGANAAIFSMFNQLLLRPLPVRDPGQLVNLGNPGPKPGSQSCNQAGDCDVVFSYPMFRDLERAPSAFTGIAAHRLFGANLAYKGQTPLSVEGMLVSGGYFNILGLRPALGRLLTPEDDRTIGGHFVTVLSHRYWETRLGSDPGVLNQTLVVNGQSMTIVGVAPKGFDGTTLGARPSVFVPLTMRESMTPAFRGGFENRRQYWAYLFARLKPGVSEDQAKAAINAVYKPIVNDVEAPLQEGMSDQTMQRFKAKELVLEPGRRGQSSIHTEARTPLILLFSITGIVLLIACANIANLLLARGANRALEMAVRLSLGAGRRRLLGQLLTESVLLAVMGGIVSLVVARWTLSLIASLLPPDASNSLQFSINPMVVLFAAGLSIATGLLFGLFPALHSTRTDLMTTVRANTGQPSGARAAARFRTSLVTVQIALSMTLLILAGLFVKSLVNVSRVDLGVRIDNVLTFAISPELSGYTPARSKVLFRRVEEELAALPGVTSVSSAFVPLLANSNWGNDVSVEGFKRGPDTDAGSRYNEVGPGYLRTVGVSLKAGREFTASDDAGTPKVAIINEAFARKFNLGQNAVGKRIGTGRNENLDIEIVGVMPNVKYSEVKQEIPPVFFTPIRQDSTLGWANFYVRTSQDPVQLLRVVPEVIKRLDPNLPVEELKTMPQQVRENIFLDRMISTLSAGFAVLATLLAAVGLYGVLAYTVAQRTREIGVRMALGADARRVRRMVLRQVGVMTIIGGIVGVAAALGLGKLARSLLFGLQGNDPWVIAVSAILLVMVAFVAGEIPALRASRIHPMQGLRYE